MMIDAARQKGLIEASIKNYSSGSPLRKWSILLQDFPDIPRATAYRIFAKVSKAYRPGRNLSSDMFEQPETSPKQAKAPFVPTETSGLVSPGDPLPIPQQLAKLRDLYEDATKLMERSLDKNGKIKNTSVFQKSIELRIKIATADANMAVAVMDAGRIEIVLNGISKIASKYDPDNGFYLMKEVSDYYSSMFSKPRHGKSKL